ncbi:MAG TPA: DUF6338 family protein [Allosphingosinicella sp.]|jgi:hypothetical protein
MGDLGDPTKVPALLALLAPGFIILWFRMRLVEGSTPDFKRELFYFALASAAYYGAVAPLFSIESGVALPLWLWSILFYFATPAVLGILVGWVTQHDLEYSWAETLGMHFAHRIPTAWDFRFSRLAEGAFILVTLKDGTTIAGRWAETSFASSAKDGRDVYVAEVWDIPDSGAWVPLDPPRGMLLCGGDVRYIEIFGG